MPREPHKSDEPTGYRDPGPIITSSGSTAKAVVTIELLQLENLKLRSAFNAILGLCGENDLIDAQWLARRALKGEN